MRKLFGTDGVRGIANRDLTSDLAFRLGQAAAYVLAGKLNRKPRIMVGTDTRISCDMLECAICAGLCSVGADVIRLGVIPTPGVAYLTAKYKADAGAVISASHNSYEFNGIKFFDSEAYKLPDEIEARMEEFIFSGKSLPHKTGADIGRIFDKKDYIADYLDFMTSQSEASLEGMRIILDCANGASYRAAPAVFQKLGADITVLNAVPDGININEGCGSTHPERMCRMLAEGDYDIGFAYDGDADRVVAADEKGKIIDGDQMLGILALNLKNRKKLNGDSIVVTIMSNMGLEIMARENGIGIVRTKVGDRYVIEEMRKNGYSLGGEQSGHVILKECNTTGDGILTSLKIAGILAECKKPASKMAGVMEKYPQITVNAKVLDEAKDSILTDNEINQLIRGIEEEFKGEGRLVIRPSGTEPVVRVMMEGKEESFIARKANEVAALIEKKFGRELS